MQKQITIILTIVLLLSSCGGRDYRNEGMAEDQASNNESYHQASSTKSDEYYETESTSEGNNDVENKMMTSSVARLFQDSTHKFVVRSSVKLKVDDVYSSTLKVEELANKTDGFVINSNLYSDIHREYTQKVSRDSLLEITDYVRNIDMTVKVPSHNLETFLLSLGEEISFLNYRNINAEEVRIQLKAHKWMQEQFKEYQDEIRNIKVPEQNKQTLSELEKIKAIYSQKEIEKNRLVQHWQLQDDIKYAVVNINMYGRKQQKIKKVAVADDIEQYEPSFWTKAKDGFYVGGKGIQKLFLGLITVWPLWIVLLIGWFLFRRWKKRKN